MKVLHIINNLGTGGAEKLLRDTLPYYAERGIAVDLMLLQNKDTPFLKELKENFNGKITYSNLANLYSIGQIKEIVHTIDEKNGYDIVHTHLFPTFYWMVLAKWFYKLDCKLLFTEHSTENKRLNSPLFRQVDKIIYSGLDHIIAITPAVKENLLSLLKIRESKISVVYNGIILKDFINAEPYDKSTFFSGENILLIQISRFSSQKDQPTLLRALALLPSNYKLILVGDGSNKKECQMLADSLGILDRILFLGVRRDTPELLKTSDIVIQSSHWEGFGLTAIEGMAAMKPVIASDVSGLGDLVKGHGLLFKSGDEYDLKNKILSLEDPYLYKKIRNACFLRAQDFSIEVMVDNTIELYKQLYNASNLS